MIVKKVCIENRTCYYFDCMTKLEDFDLDNLFIDEKSYENIFIYSISYKTLTDSKYLCFRFGKTAGFIRLCDGTR